jgi:TolB-like protein
VFCKPVKFLLVSTIPVILIAILHGCARPKTAGVERLAVMPIENLSSDAQLDWRSRAAAAVVVYDLEGAKNTLARQVDSVSAAQAMRATRLVEGYFFERNGRMGIHATLEDLNTNSTVQSFDIEGAVSAGFLQLANELAHRLSAEARMLPATRTHSDPTERRCQREIRKAWRRIWKLPSGPILASRPVMWTKRRCWRKPATVQRRDRWCKPESERVWIR